MNSFKVLKQFIYILIASISTCVLEGMAPGFEQNKDTFLFFLNIESCAWLLWRTLMSFNCFVGKWRSWGSGERTGDCFIAHLCFENLFCNTVLFLIIFQATNKIGKFFA